MGYTIYAAATGTEFNTGHLLLATGGGAIAGALIGTGVGIAAGISEATATTAAVTGAGIATTTASTLGSDGDYTNEMQAAATTINTGSTVVYQYIENGVVRYYGITNDFARRAAEHLYSRGWTIEKIPGLDSLSRYDARSVEQVLIENAGLPNLFNQINSIATSNAIYTEAIKNGTYILQQIGLIPK